MEAETAKRAWDVVSSALHGQAAASPGAPRRAAKLGNERWKLIKLSMKLSELTENWRDVAGEPLASRSAPAACEEKDGRLLVTVNVKDQMVLSSARFRALRLERGISAFLDGAEVSVEFKIGPLRRPRGVNAVQPKIYRRAPVISGESEIAEREKYFLEGGLSPELSSAMARVMLSLEKLSKRR